MKEQARFKATYKMTLALKSTIIHKTFYQFIGLAFENLYSWYSAKEITQSLPSALIGFPNIVCWRHHHLE